MRRSAAPSQVLGNAGKKPRFIPPGKCVAACLKSETKEMDQELKLKEIDEKEGGDSLLSKINVQNQNENFTQSVESRGRVKTKACFSTDKCSKAEMKMLNVPKAAHLLFGWFLVQEYLVFHPSLTSANASSKRNFARSHGRILSLS